MIRVNKITKYTKNLNLLYVEDDIDTRDEMLNLYEDMFLTVTTAVDGKDGLDKFNSNHNLYHLIITDINMPKMNGLQMTQKIRDINHEIPILMLSACNDVDFFMQSITVGVSGYILKPFDMKQFTQIMANVIDNIRLKEDSKKNLNFLLQYQDIADDSAIVSKTDTKGIITYANDEFCKISGYTKAELIGKSHNIIRDPNTPKEIYENLWDTIKNKKQVWRGVLKNIAKDGHSYYVKSIVKPIVDVDGNIIEYIALRDDITEVMSPTRQLEDLVKNADESIVVLIQIEDFENIQKYYGKELVDILEDKFGKWIYEIIPNKCNFEKVYPLGEGRYAFAKDKARCSIGIENILKDLHQFQKIVNESKMEIDDFDYNIKIVVSFAYGIDALENAKYGISKLIKTKQDFIVANDLVKQEQEQASKHLQILRIIKDAIKNYRIVSYFQPIVDNKTKKIVKYESLVRLIDKDDNVLNPFFFLDVAKKGKYYSQITKIVLENSFNALKYTDMDISMNLSALDIESKSMRDTIFALLEKNKEYGSRVVFELLEDEAVKDFKTIVNFINEVKEYGVKIAIDDFGAGYSNFERLLEYQPDILKIDACLIKNIQTDSYSLSVVKTIVAFAKEQNIITLAEYVENEEVFNIIKDLGVDYTQGYYFGEPNPLRMSGEPIHYKETNM